MTHALICARSVVGSGKIEGLVTLITMIPVDGELVGLCRKPGETESQLQARARAKVWDRARAKARVVGDA